MSTQSVPAKPRAAIMRESVAYFEDLAAQSRAEGNLQEAHHWALQAASVRHKLAPTPADTSGD